MLKFAFKNMAIKKVQIILIVLSIVLVLLLTAIFWNPILDFLPIDQSGWKTKGDRLFFLNEDGDPLTGWQELDGNRYYFDPQSGALHTGWLVIPEGTYYLNEEGIMQRGWLTLENSRRFFLPDGRLATGLFEADQASYFADHSGVLQTGWQEADGIRRYFSSDGVMQTGWLELDGSRYYLDETGAMCTGWADTDAGHCYLGNDGALQYGWLELENGLYYLGTDGIMYTGWLELDGVKYYLKEDGTAARGTLAIDGTNYFFTSTGANIIMVNRWNYIPEDYTVELKALPNGRKVSEVCYDSLVAMVNACSEAGCHPDVIDGHRTAQTQRALFRVKLEKYLNSGNSYGTAYAKAKATVADPGTSEHELGLAVDILDVYYPTSYTGTRNCLTWLREHCWEYGWILRYPDDKKDITGIKFEPWHFRYVGVELAMELKDSGLCLEEYLDLLTGDGTTCGNPDASANAE